MTALIVIAVGWLLFRLITRPFKNCRRCGGMGRIARPSGHGRPHPCKRCKGTGLTVRPSARIFGFAARNVAGALNREADHGSTYTFEEDA